MNSTSIKVACSNCNLRELCMPLGLNESEMERVDEVVATRRKVARGDNLFRQGDKVQRAVRHSHGLLQNTHLR